MPQVGFTIDGRAYTFAEALDYAESGAAPAPAELVRALMSDRDDKVPTASSLTGCLRRFQLQKQHDYYTPLEDGLPALLGTALHAEVARHANQEQALAEWHMEVPLWLPEVNLHIPISGTADYVNPQTGVLRDYKSKVYLPPDWYVQPAHIGQVNIYHWLWTKYGFAGEGGEPLNQWEIVYFSQSAVRTFRGALADVAATERWLVKTLTRYVQAELDGTLLPPLPALAETKANGSPAAPCSYCPVRQHCIAALQTQVDHDDNV